MSVSSSKDKCAINNVDQGFLPEKSLAHIFGNMYSFFGLLKELIAKMKATFWYCASPEKNLT